MVGWVAPGRVRRPGAVVGCGDAATAMVHDAWVSQRLTIKDVADAARVSPATVSRVLNGKVGVDPQLAQRVRSTANRLGYRPNLTAIGLARGRTGMVGVVVPDLANPFFPELLKGIAAAASERDSQVLVADADEDVAREERLVEELSRRCDGLVLCSARMSVPKLRRLAGIAVPFVLANRVERDLDVPAAAIDIGRTMRAVVDHLVGLGHRRIGYLAGPRHSWSNTQRAAAFRASTAERQVRGMVVPAGSTTEEGHLATEKLLRSRVSALVAFNDLVAFGALSRFRDAGRDAPADISIVGFDDIPAAEYAAPPLTTVRFPTAELGRVAWELLRDRLEGRPPARRWLEAELVIRGSTAPPPDR